jgi:hypothetical protein
LNVLRDKLLRRASRAACYVSAKEELLRRSRED